ncbi:MAG TPA: hypothetical protein VHU43_07535 [Steroidobacteraceae bacterium]|jgi:hypothetical protein|nr:hypothetical protein [Steroidobacteraceae bacterium]
MEHFYYARHFGVLGAATVVLFLLGHWTLLADSLVLSFAANGALHACALVLTLRSPQRPLRRACFVALAAVLSILTMYVGIVGLVAFAAIPGNERLYLVLGLCSLSGAITYGSLVRMFWIRRFSPRLIMAMAFLCLLATSLGFLARSYSDFLGGWWLAAVWWFAFSGALWFFDTHPNALNRPKYNRA